MRTSYGSWRTLPPAIGAHLPLGFVQQHPLHTLATARDRLPRPKLSRRPRSNLSTKSSSRTEGSYRLLTLSQSTFCVILGTALIISLWGILLASAEPLKRT